MGGTFPKAPVLENHCKYCREVRDGVGSPHSDQRCCSRAGCQLGEQAGHCGGSSGYPLTPILAHGHITQVQRLQNTKPFLAQPQVAPSLTEQHPRQVGASAPCFEISPIPCRQGDKEVARKQGTSLSLVEGPNACWAAPLGSPLCCTGLQSKPCLLLAAPAAAH